MKVHLVLGNMALLAVVGLVLGAAALAQAQVTLFQNGVSPSPEYAGCKDAWISDNPYEGGSYAKSQTLTCGNKRTILIQFDLSSLPKDTAVSKAVLRLRDTAYPRKDKTGQFVPSMQAFRLERAWDENANWKRHSPPEKGKEKEANPELEWKSPGGEMDKQTDYGAGATGVVASDMVIDGLAGHVHELDLTKLVAKWVAQPESNFGIALVLPEKAPGAVAASSEWYVPAARPMLIVATKNAAIEALAPAAKDVPLHELAATADAASKPDMKYATVRVGQNANCALRGASTDGYVKEANLKYPGDWGWLDMCRVGGRGGDVSRALLYFDLKEIAKGASIQSAKLRLSLVPFSCQQVESYRYGAYLLSLPDQPGWSAEADLANRKAGAAWGSGGVVAASAGAPAAIGKVIAHNDKNRRMYDAIEFDLTGLVRAWAEGKAPNCGIVLDNRLEGGAYDFYSSRAFKPEQRPYLEISLSPGIDKQPQPIAEVATQPSGDYWVEPMKKLHKTFTGKKALCILYGDSITYSMAFLGSAAYGNDPSYKNMDEATKADVDAVWKHADRKFWQKRDPSLGHLGQMKSDWFLSNIDGWQKKHQPEAGVILFGSNDLGGLLPPEYTENMAAGIRRMMQDGTVPLLTTVPPASGRDVWCPHYYMACSIIARHFQIPVIDYYAEIMKRRPEDWNGALPKFAQDQLRPNGSKDEYAVKTLISADGVHPSNRAEYGKDFGDEALSNNGFNLRDYMTLRKYGEVIRKVFQAE